MVVEFLSPTKDDVVGKVYTVLNAGKYMFAGPCKLLNANGRDYPVGSKAKILEVEENTDGDKKRQPFIATKYEKMTNA